MPDLTPRQLAKLPLTDRHLTRHERRNLAVVLRCFVGYSAMYQQMGVNWDWASAVEKH
ncbi:hypothetical protein AB0N16_37515 [Streptomyces sp. NPDC051105]|uniref:hypothetical protein n=1 Tax=Streptomyces sp. NPDC051105 TaxID=3154843 RepID=UPI00341BA739